ncbi:MAG TPA: hypothetical protein PJ982_12910, partial [Lacipirellulaceae bacterium]|nr:hypothetical protein [Lacipirellulaceae bacterium]
IHEFLIPQFVNDQLPDQLRVHGFGEDGNGELYAMVTNSPSNGAGGIVYKFIPIPEPASRALAMLAGVLLPRMRRSRARAKLGADGPANA